MSNIGVFDSGLGGLTCVKELHRLMPNENIIYFGDTKRVPYGSRSKETICEYVKSDIEFLLNWDIKLIIAACGTAGSVCLDEVAPLYDVDIIGVVKPASEAAVNNTKNKRIGILGTKGTIASSKYNQEILSLDKNIKLVQKACPLFVPFVESGITGGTAIHLIAEEYLLPLKNQEVDTIVLGCTHYPLLSDVISDIMGDGTVLIDSGLAAAHAAMKHLIKRNLVQSKGGKLQFYVSDDIHDFEELGGSFLGQNITGMIKKVDIGF